MGDLKIPIPGGDVEAFIQVVGMVAAPGAVSLITVEHDDECPCMDGKHSLESCTCELVNVILPERHE